MGKLILVAALFICSCSAFAQSFISPIGFSQTEANKSAVVAFIKKQVYEDCTKLGANDASTLRMMEDANLKAFKELLTKTNTTLLQQVIKQCCDIGACNYSTISMMYNQQEKDSKQELKW